MADAGWVRGVIPLAMERVAFDGDGGHLGGGDLDALGIEPLYPIQLFCIRS